MAASHLRALVHAAAFAALAGTGVGVAFAQEQETAGNNLSIPAYFIGGGGPALRVPCGTYLEPGDDGVPSSSLYPGYWLQQTTATWSADCNASSTTANVIADWGDNLTTRPNIAAGKPVRVEVVLLDPTATGMRGFYVINLTPELPDNRSTYGTRGAPDDAFTTAETGTPAARVYDNGAVLTIEKQNGDGSWDLLLTEDPMPAEINATGGVVYGYNWGSKGRKNTPTAGIYRLTFTTNNTTITGISDTAALVVPTFTPTSTSLVITLTSGNSGKGGRGPQGPGGPN